MAQNMQKIKLPQTTMETRAVIKQKMQEGKNWDDLVIEHDEESETSYILGVQPKEVYFRVGIPKEVYLVIHISFLFDILVLIYIGSLDYLRFLLN